MSRFYIYLFIQISFASIRILAWRKKKMVDNKLFEFEQCSLYRINFGADCYYNYLPDILDNDDEKEFQQIEKCQGYLYVCYLIKVNGDIEIFCYKNHSPIQKGHNISDMIESNTYRIIPINCFNNLPCIVYASDYEKLNSNNNPNNLNQKSNYCSENRKAAKILKLNDDKLYGNVLIIYAKKFKDLRNFNQVITTNCIY